MIPAFPPHRIAPDLWRDVAPLAVEADRAERRITRRIAAVIAALVAIWAVLAWTGISRARLEYHGGGGGYSAPARTMFTDIEVHNGGILAERLASVRSTAPGLEVTSASMDGGSIRPGHDGVIRIRLRVTDCDALRPWAASGRTDAVEVRTHRPWGSTPAPSLADAVSVAVETETICGWGEDDLLGPVP